MYVILMCFLLDNKDTDIHIFQYDIRLVNLIGIAVTSYLHSDRQ
jgi:hypothetical protein